MTCGYRRRITVLLRYIEPALDGLDPAQPPEVLPSAAVEGNVRRTIRQVLESPEGKARAARADVKLVGAVYEIAAGRVRILQ